MASGFIGNTNIRDRLRSLVEADRLHPCLLFEGPPGLGKATTAIWLATVANCDADMPSQRPCGGCWSCRQIPKGNHPDVLTVGLDTSKTASIISVAQARAVISQLTVKPFHARKRFVIIDPADAMTPEAANALLKTFEDPPELTHFILVTGAPASLLLTVRSRSQRIRFAPVATGELSAWLEERGMEQAELVAAAAEGCPGRALGLDLTGSMGWRNARDAFLEALQGDTAARLKFAENLCRGERSKWLTSVEETLDAIATLLRDGLAVRSGGKAFYNEDRPEVVEVWARALEPASVAGLADALSDARERLDRFVSGRLVMDALLARLRRVLDHGGRCEAV